MFENKNVTVFVTGGIAVYKACDLVRRFIKAGANVRVAMTKSATEFVQPLTFQILSKNKVLIDTFDESDEKNVSHIELADWTELAVVAPATANIIAKMAQGIADDMVSTTLLATTAPRLIVPAMNVNMWNNPATVTNIKTLREYGYTVLEPATGFLAEGYEGKGRLPEPEQIVEATHMILIRTNNTLPLHGKKVLISAGGTKERIDPVRYLTNQSSGKMGHRLAEAARDMGATVSLVTAATTIERPFGMKVVSVESATEMQKQLMNRYEDSDIVIMAAAVSDFKPVHQADQKIKKTADNLTLELEKNPDILATMGQMKSKQFLIGFAAETQDVEKYALDKLARKKADMIVANDVSDPNAGFDKETNEVTLYQNQKDPIHIANTTKYEVAKHILLAAIDQ